MKSLIRLAWEQPNNLLVRVVRMYPQDEAPPHCHEFSELVMITGGSGIHVVDGWEHPVAAQDIFFLREGQIHEYRKARNLRLINILFREETLNLASTELRGLPGYHALFTVGPGLAEASSGLARVHIRVMPDRWRKLIRLVMRLEDELDGETEGWLNAAQAILILIIIEASRAYPGQLDPGSLRLAEVFTLIERQLHRCITTPELAEAANLSLSTLQRHFSSLTGETLISYIKRRRVDRAAELLCETNLSITEIAFRTGFEDSNYFAKVFRAIKGASPRHYRKTRDVDLNGSA